MAQEEFYAYFEIRPGMDVYTADGQHLGTIESLWQVDENGQARELALLAGICPAERRDGEVVARFCVAESGYMVVSSGLMPRQEWQLPFEAIAEVRDDRVVLARTRADLTPATPPSRPAGSGPAP